MPEAHQILSHVLFFVLGGVVVAFTNHILTKSRDKQAMDSKTATDLRHASADFLRVLNPVIERLENRGHANEIWKEKLTDLDAAVAAFRKMLPNARQSGFDEAWNAYRKVDQASLVPQLIRLPTGSMTHDYETGRNLLLPLLQKLKACASDS